MKRTSSWIGIMLAILAAPLTAQQSRFVQPVPPPEEGVIGQAFDLPATLEPKMHDWETKGFGHRVCPGMYVDPRDGTVLRLVRSVSSEIAVDENGIRVTRVTSYGDYWISRENRYKMELGQALRINCVDGTPIGVVARFPAETNPH